MSKKTLLCLFPCAAAARGTAARARRRPRQQRPCTLPPSSWPPRSESLQPVCSWMSQWRWVNLQASPGSEAVSAAAVHQGPPLSALTLRTHPAPLSPTTACLTRRCRHRGSSGTPGQSACVILRACAFCRITGPIYNIASKKVLPLSQCLLFSFLTLELNFEEFRRQRKSNY